MRKRIAVDIRRSPLEKARRIKLIIEYDGTAYVGWQRQKNGPTVQAAIERILGLMTGEPVSLHGAGRTDAGVHALGQVAHFSTSKDLDPAVYKQALNKLLPDDIVIREALEVKPDFHARYSAAGKTYRYLILNRRTPSAFTRNQVWHYPRELDLAAMAECLRMIEGKHDFSSFRNTGSNTRSPVRTVLKQGIERNEDGLITITLSADGFLRQMVRNIVGTLVEAGRGKITPADFKEILAARDRSKAGPTAPPQGLYLVEVDYGRRG